MTALRKLVFALVVSGAAFLGLGDAFAQDDPGFNLTDALGNFGAQEEAEPVTFDAKFVLLEGARTGSLTVRAKMADKWHIYSLTQPKGGPTPSKLTVPEGAGYKLLGKFTADRDPEIHNYPDIYDVEVQEYAGAVEFTARIEIDGDPAKLTIPIRYDGLVCKDEQGGLGRCEPLSNVQIKATFGGYYAAPSGKYRPENAHVSWEAWVEPKVAVAGGKVRLQFRATPDAGYHVYNLQERDPADGNKPTLIALTKLAGAEELSRKASAEPHAARAEGEQPYYEGPVTWTVELKLPAKLEGAYAAGGLLGFQTCKDSGCDPPAAAKFQLSIPVAASEQPGKLPIRLEAGGAYGAVAKAVEQAAEGAGGKAGDGKASMTWTMLLSFVGMGLLGGVILNAMPCVLPVLAFKIHGFAEQAGQSRGRIFMLNVWFSLGVLAVFMILATLAATLNLGWGEQFTSMWFKVTLVTFVFAMALSFLGVWEIPIPGFVGGDVTSKLQQKEGVFGAFFKGVFTTVLATPCSGPFLGPIFGELVKHPPIYSYIIFGSIGLGLSLPYLLIGAVPGLMRFLPKPGPWMESFKHSMGFVMLGVVVYPLLYAISDEYLLATFGLLMGTWLGCWILGHGPVGASLPVRFRTWATAAVAASLVGYTSFTYLTPQKHDLPWETYSPTALAAAQEQGKTVLVDFTAKWCLTCQLNFHRAIDTPTVKKIVEENNVVTLYADWTDYSPVIKKSLSELNANSIPLLAIYPAAKPAEPIVLPDVLSESTVIRALKDAGPSLGGDAPVESTVMSEYPTGN